MFLDFFCSDLVNMQAVFTCHRTWYDWYANDTNLLSKWLMDPGDALVPVVEVSGVFGDSPGTQSFSWQHCRALPCWQMDPNGSWWILNGIWRNNRNIPANILSIKGVRGRRGNFLASCLRLWRAECGSDDVSSFTSFASSWCSWSYDITLTRYECKCMYM